MAKQSNVVQLDPKRALEVFADRIETILERRKRDRASLGKLLCDTQALFKNIKGNIDAGKWADWLETRFKAFDLSRATAYRYMDAYRNISNEIKTEKRGRPKGSGRSRGGRGRSGGKADATDGAAQAVAAPPAVSTPAAVSPPPAGQEGAASTTPAPSASLLGVGELGEQLAKLGWKTIPAELYDRVIAPASEAQLERGTLVVGKPIPALEMAAARVKELEQAQAVLMETNRDLAEQLDRASSMALGGWAATNPQAIQNLARKAGMIFPEEVGERDRAREVRIHDLLAQIEKLKAEHERAATDYVNKTQTRILDLSEKLRDRDCRIDELNVQIAAGIDGATKKRLDNQAKVIEDLRKSEAEQKRSAEACRKPGPRGLATLFGFLKRGEQMEFMRALASCDDPAPGEQDTDKVGWIEIVFKKIHSPQTKRELLGNLSSGELADVLAKHATSITPTSERKPVEHRRLAEPGELLKKPARSPNGRHT